MTDLSFRVGPFDTCDEFVVVLFIGSFPIDGVWTLLSVEGFFKDWCFAFRISSFVDDRFEFVFRRRKARLLHLPAS